MEQIKKTMDVYFTSRIITNENAPCEFQIKIYKDEQEAIGDYNDFVSIDESFISINHKVAQLLENYEKNISVEPVVFASNSEGSSKMKVFRQQAAINCDHEYIYTVLATVISGIDIMDTKLIVTTNKDEILCIRNNQLKQLTESISKPDEIEVIIDSNTTSRLRYKYKDIPDAIIDISLCKFSFEY